MTTRRALPYTIDSRPTLFSRVRRVASGYGVGWLGGTQYWIILYMRTIVHVCAATSKPVRKRNFPTSNSRKCGVHPHRERERLTLCGCPCMFVTTNAQLVRRHRRTRFLLLCRGTQVIPMVPTSFVSLRGELNDHAPINFTWGSFTPLKFVQPDRVDGAETQTCFAGWLACGRQPAHS